MSTLKESVFTRHEPCPRCRERGQDKRGNNLARYSDGHAYCHACGYYESGDKDRSENNRKTSEKQPGNKTRPAPVQNTGREPLNRNLSGKEKADSGNPEQENSNKREFIPLCVAFRALKPRGLTMETCRHFGYGIGSYQGQPCHVAPFFNVRRNLAAQHVRLEGKEFRWLGNTGEITLFGQHLWPRGGRRVVVTEGEIDCMSVSQIQGNRWPVVSVPNGAQSAAKYLKASLEWLEAFEEIVLAFDMDEPGQKAAMECALLFTPGKARIARMPMKDANECLLAGLTRELTTALWEAVPWRPDGIRSGTDLWDEVCVPPPEGFSAPYPELSAMLGGLRPGELYLFTAGSGIGKSTIVSEIAYHLKMTHGLAVGVLALEESPARNARRYLGIHCGVPLHIPKAGQTVPPELLRTAFDKVLGDGRWWIYDHFGSTDIDTLLAKLRYMAVALGVNVIVLDHISIIVSGLDEQENESERRTIDRLMTKLRSLVEETGIMILAVAHLKRPEKGKSFNEGRPVTLTDLRGSGALEQLSDVVVALERNQQGNDPDTAMVRILKNRPLGLTGPAGFVRYERTTGRLLSVSGNNR